ncbi:proline-rich receptor-like protein kinase PERK1 [Daucus carota subsp. sativus]|uniref:proline-rich receptor-like protein kinase PERK1 n=1 Tax=Daucus carota subsp. sativus TaxID=79200 RepID=UPI003082B119
MFRVCCFVLIITLIIQDSTILCATSPLHAPTYAPAYSPTNAPTDAPAYTPTNAPTDAPAYTPKLAPKLSPKPTPPSLPSPSKSNSGDIPHSPPSLPSVSPPPQSAKSRGGSNGMKGGQKAGLAIGVIAGAALVGFGGMVYAKRRQNIRRSRFMDSVQLSTPFRREFPGNTTRCCSCNFLLAYSSEQIEFVLCYCLVETKNEPNHEASTLSSKHLTLLCGGSPAPAPGPKIHKAPAPTPTYIPSPSPRPPQSWPSPSHHDKDDSPPSPSPRAAKFRGSSKGMSGGQKVGLAFGVIVGAALLGFAGMVYAKRRSNIRRSRNAGSVQLGAAFVRRPSP